MLLRAQAHRRNVLILGVWLGVCAHAGPARGRPVAGVVIQLEGQPQVSDVADGKDRQARPNMFIYDGDVVRTAAGERLTVALINGAELRINEKSSVEIEHGGGKGRTATLSVSLGQVWVRLLHGLGPVHLRTPVGSVIVPEGELDLEVDRGALLKVYAGEAELAVSTTGKASARVGPGQMLRVAQDGTPGRTVGLPAGGRPWHERLAPPPTPAPSVTGPQGPGCARARAQSRKQPVAEVTGLHGSPEIKCGSASPWESIHLHQSLYPGDAIKTRFGETLAAALKNGEGLRVNETSTLRLESPEKGRPAPVVLLTQGQIWLRSPRPDAVLDVKSPVASAHICGAEVDLKFDTALRIRVYGGLVDVDNVQGASQLREGQQILVRGERPPPAPTPMGADRETWQDGARPE